MDCETIDIYAYLFMILPCTAGSIFWTLKGTRNLLAKIILYSYACVREEKDEIHNGYDMSFDNLANSTLLHTNNEKVIIIITFGIK